MPLLRRNTPLEGIEVNASYGVPPVALDHGEGFFQHWREARPGRAEALVDAARAPLLGALADLVGREEPARLCAGQLAFIGVGGAMGQSDAHRALHGVAEVVMQFG